MAGAHAHRAARRPRKLRLVVPLALGVTAAGVTIGAVSAGTVAAAPKPTREDLAAAAVTAALAGPREVTVSRSEPRTELAPVPAPSTPAALTYPVCPDGTAIEKGLTAKADKLYRAVCAQFPELKVYGGRDNHGEHVDGRAIDFMVYGDRTLGQEIADWIQAHAKELSIDDVIWWQHIWQPARPTWILMSDRGGATENHEDHVHARVTK